MSDTKKYKNFAFISYSHRDKRLAESLEKTLTRFSLPSKLQKKHPEKPKNLRPICKDTETFRNNRSLKAVIKNELRESKFLIVICSENSAKPNCEGKNWINDEIMDFIHILGEEQGLCWELPDVKKLITLLQLVNVTELNKDEETFCQENGIDWCKEQLFHKERGNWKDEDFEHFVNFLNPNYEKKECDAIKKLITHVLYERIISILHRPASLLSWLGIKNKPEPRKCTPPALSAFECREEDIQVLGKYRAFSNTIASMLDIEPDELWDRYGRYLKRKAIINTVVKVTVMCGAIYAYDYYVPKEKYYIDYVECNNIPIGIGELQEENIKTRLYHYRFLYQHHKLQSVKKCDSYGELSRVDFGELDDDRAAEIVFSKYHTNGNVAESLHYNYKGELMRRLRYPDLYTIECKNIHAEDYHEYYRKQLIPEIYYEFMIGNFTDIDYTAPYPVLTPNVYSVTRTEKGYIKEKYSKIGIINKRHCPDLNGVWGYQYEYDALGRVTQVLYIDKKLDVNGRPMRISSRGVCGEKREYEDLYEKSRYTIDERGQEKPADGDSASRIVITRDLVGNPTCVSAFSPDGNPADFPIPKHTQEYGQADFSSLHYEYNPNDGRLIKMYHMDKDGNKCDSSRLFKSHAISIEYKQENNNLVTTMRHYDTNDSIKFIAEHEYNSKENVTTIKGFDKDGSLKKKTERRTNNGFTQWIKEFDANKELLVMKRYSYSQEDSSDPNNYTCISAEAEFKDGSVMKELFEYDSLLGLETSRIVMYSEDFNKPCLCTKKTIQYSFDLGGALTLRLAYYKPSRSLPQSLEPAFQEIINLDNNGYITRIEYRNKLGNLIHAPTGELPSLNGPSIIDVYREDDICILNLKNTDGETYNWNNNLMNKLSLQLRPLLYDQPFAFKNFEHSSEKIETKMHTNGGKTQIHTFLDNNNDTILIDGICAGYKIEFNVKGEITSILFFDKNEKIIFCDKQVNK